jgi:Xaa-Pro aminopeptidase
MNQTIPVIPVRQQADIIADILRKRLDGILPAAMREAGVDMWLIICQEDDYDPVFRSMVPMNTWAPILQMLIFYDPPGGGVVERINLSMTDTGDLYQRPWSGRDSTEQWQLLSRLIQARDPRRIGINTGAIQWSAGGLTHNLYNQLVSQIPPKYVDRLVSAEPVATRWLATLSDEEIELYPHVIDVARRLIERCYSREAIIPGVTTTQDLEWFYWQACADLGLPVSFKPFFNLVRGSALQQQYGEADQILRAGDLIHCDVGITYLRLTSDHQQWAYLLRSGEKEAPPGIQHLMAEANRLQSVFMSQFEAGRSGNEMLRDILSQARQVGIPNPRVYSHSLGLYLHEPGPLIGLPWEQERCEGRGDVRLTHNQAFTMELSVRQAVPEWDGQEVNFSIEEDVVFTSQGCRLINGRQTRFYLI